MPVPLYIQVKALTGVIQILIICCARDFPGVCASPLFLPTFFITESLLLRRMPRLRGNTLGDCRRRMRDTGLLYIAGEKTRCSGTLGPRYPFRASRGGFFMPARGAKAVA